MKQNLALILAGLFALILGSYGYTSFLGSSIEARISDRLTRIEQKLDRIIERGW